LLVEEEVHKQKVIRDPLVEVELEEWLKDLQYLFLLVSIP
jgi:hypothetical protein